MKVLQVLDDVDTTPDASTVEFSYRGKSYAIDLAAANAAQLDAEIGFWIDHARPAGKASKPSNHQTVAAIRASHEVQGAEDWWSTPPNASPAEKEEFAEIRRRIRLWGASHGYPSLGERGRIPRSLAAAWQAKHRSDSPVTPRRDDDDDDDPTTDTEQADPELEFEPEPVTKPRKASTTRRSTASSARGRAAS
jgi:hypothetical protein